MANHASQAPSRQRHSQLVPSSVKIGRRLITFLRFPMDGCRYGMVTTLLLPCATYKNAVQASARIELISRVSSVGRDLPYRLLAGSLGVYYTSRLHIISNGPH